jgi:hypothetical protein
MDQNPNIWVEFINFLGLINNDTGIQGKSFIFKINIETEQFECILFIHPTSPAFVTSESDKFDSDLLLKLILMKYKLEDLLAYEDK